MRCLVTMKNHTTVTITMKMLEDAGACTSGMVAAQPFLPAKISTDPEQNLTLALEIAQCELGEHLAWFEGAFVDIVDIVYCECDYCLPKLYPAGRDPMIIAQQLAHVADALATKEGR